MANFDDMRVGPSFTALAVAEGDTILYCESGAIRFTSHSTPIGATLGVPLREGEALVVKAGTQLFVKADSAVEALIVRTTT